MVVQHNMASMNANRNLSVSTGSIKKSTEKLSSGYKINRAADDAAGLTISEKMRSQIRGLTQASSNTQDGVSFCQIADGALDEVQGMLKRCNELAIQAANGTNTDADREAIQKEISQISSEIDRVHESVLFNDLRVFPDSGNAPDTEMSSMSSGSLSREVVVGNTVISLEFIGSDGNKVDNVATDGTQATGKANSDSVANSNMAKFVVDAAASAVDKLGRTYPNLFSKASSNGIKVGLELSSEGKGNTLATAALSLQGNSTGTTASYRLWVDTADYPVDKFDSMTPEQKADLAATISHEMTHLVMYDTLTSGMVGNNFPDWFIEGMAQTSSGDNGWMSNHLNAASSDADINSYKNEMLTSPYGAGYAACMYLGQLASRETDVTSTNIAKGLDKVLTTIAEKIEAKEPANTILDKALQEVIGMGTTAFQNKFMSTAGGADSSLDFMKNLIAARGTNGAGSILGALNASEATVHNISQPVAANSSYTVDPSNQWFSNGFGSGFVFPQNLPSSHGGGGEGNDRDGFIIQAGAANRTEQQIFVKQFNISNSTLFDNKKMDVSTLESARASIALAQKADAKISAVRSYYGAMQNRMEHTISNLDNVVENTTAAESRIRDTDMATEMVNYTKTNVLIQAGNAMLSQAMQQPQSVLQLLS